MYVGRIINGVFLGGIALLASLPVWAGNWTLYQGTSYHPENPTLQTETENCVSSLEICRVHHEPAYGTSCGYTGYPNDLCYRIQYWNTGGDGSTPCDDQSGTIWNQETQQCEIPPPTCTAGESISWGGASTTTACSGGCLVTTVGVSIQLEDGGLWLGDWQQTGEQCTDQPPHTPETPQTDLLGNNCITNSKGDQVCIDNQAPNCGYLNGVYTCLESIPPGNCYVLSGGSYICDSASTTPPAPNSGTPGTKAIPDLKLQVASAGASSEYFGVDTVGASSGQVDETGNYTPGASGPAAGGGTSSGSGSGSGSGETETATPAAPGDFPALGEGSGPGTVAANLGQIGDALFGPGSMYDSVTNVGLSTPAGSCPTATFDVFDGSFTLDLHCSLYESAAPTLQLVFTAIWALSAVVTVMRA